MGLARVALGCCRATADAPPDELYPDPDSDLLVRKLGEVNVKAVKVAWDDPTVDWSLFSAVVLRSTWDGIDRPEEFLRWTQDVSTQSELHNPAAVVAWNIDKHYLLDLEAAGIKTIPTRWVAPGERWDPPAGEFIVKPAVGAGSRNTARYSEAKAVAAEQHVSMLGTQAQTALVQAYLPSIESIGETSLIFIDGRFGYAVRKGGFLNLDEGILEKPWERMTYLGRCEPSAAELALAERSFDVAQERTTEPLIYGRVDLVSDDQGQPLVIEMELIDPFLSLSEAPHGAEDLAKAIARPHT